MYPIYIYYTFKLYVYTMHCACKITNRALATFELTITKYFLENITFFRTDSPEGIELPLLELTGVKNNCSIQT